MRFVATLLLALSTVFLCSAPKAAMAQISDAEAFYDDSAAQTSSSALVTEKTLRNIAFFSTLGAGLAYMLTANGIAMGLATIAVLAFLVNNTVTCLFFLVAFMAIRFIVSMGGGDKLEKKLSKSGKAGASKKLEAPLFRAIQR